MVDRTVAGERDIARDEVIDTADQDIIHAALLHGEKEGAVTIEKMKGEKQLIIHTERGAAFPAAALIKILGNDDL